MIVSQRKSYRKSHFAPAFFFLPKKRREALQVLYEVCRVLDDAVDVPHENPQVFLDAWSTFFRDHNPKGLASFHYEDLAQDFLQIAQEFSLPWDIMMELIDKGVKIDLRKDRFETPMETESYCYGVGGTVGIVCLPIFGVPLEEARPYATRLGIAVQWVNIVRDVGVDARMGRIYLPLEHLEQFGVQEKDLLLGNRNSAFDNLIAHETNVAYSQFKRAFELFPEKWNKELLPARVMGAIYFDLLTKIKKANYPVLERKVRLNFFEKIYSTWKVIRK